MSDIQVDDRVPPDPGLPSKRGGPRPPRPLFLDAQQPSVKVEQTGRWSYTLRVRHGVFEENPYRYALGSRRHADAKARRILRRRLRAQERAQDCWTIAATGETK